MSQVSVFIPSQFESPEVNHSPPFFLNTKYVCCQHAIEENLEEHLIYLMQLLSLWRDFILADCLFHLPPITWSVRTSTCMHFHLHALHLCSLPQWICIIKTFYTGSEGKLTLTEQKVDVLQAVGSMSKNTVSGAPTLQNLSTSVVELFIPFLSSEGKSLTFSACLCNSV